MIIQRPSGGRVTHGRIAAEQSATTSTPAAVALSYVAVLVYVVLWASGFIPSRVLLREMPPLWAAVVRLLLAGVLLTAFALVRRLSYPRNRREWRAAALVGVLTNVVYLALVYAALRRLSAGMAAIIASTNPLLLALVAPRLLGERLSRAKVLGLLVGFGGVASVMAARAGSPTERPADALVALISVLGLVGATVVYKRTGFAARALVAVTGIQLLVGAAALLPVACALEGQPSLPRTAEGWWALAYLVLVMSVGASLLWFWLLRHGDATRVSAFYFLVPAIGLLLSHWTLGEPLGARDLLGAVGIAVGIALVQRAGQGTRRLDAH